MKMRWIVAVCILGLVSGAATAAPMIEVGPYFLAPDTPGQHVPIHVTPGAEGPVEVTGFNLKAQIGDGLGGNPEPVFEAVTFAGTLWDAHPHTVIGGPLAGNEQFLEVSVAFNETIEVEADGLLATLLVDTTGFRFRPGTDTAELNQRGAFSLRLSSTDIGVDSQFVMVGGDTLRPEFQYAAVPEYDDGNIILPEPVTLALLASGAAALLVRRKHAVTARSGR